MRPAPRNVALALSIYTAAGIEQARQAYASICQFELAAVESHLRLTIAPIEGAPQATSDEFLNYALCASLEERFTERE